MSRPLWRGKYADDERLEAVIRAVVAWWRVHHREFDAAQRKLHLHRDEKVLFNAVEKWAKQIGLRP